MIGPVSGPSPPLQLQPGTTRSGSRHASSSVGGSYAGLLRNIQLLLSLLQPQSQSTSIDVLTQIGSVQSDITDFSRRLNEADPEDSTLDDGKWQDKLDSEGTQIWNQSTIRKYAATGTDGQEGQTGLVGRKEREAEGAIVAKLRSIGYKLIVLGAVDLASKEVLCSILNLSTKAALACLAVDKIDYNGAQELLIAGSSWAKALGNPSPLKPTQSQPTPPTSEPAKALLSHYLARAKLATMNQTEMVAHFAMNQIKKDLEAPNCLAAKEKARLAQSCHELGKMMLVQSREHMDEAEGMEGGDEVKAGRRAEGFRRVELGRGWLIWGVGLLDELKMKNTAELKISSLRLLAQACLESETPLLAEGEATLETLLEAEPSSPSLFRRYIRLIIQRESSDQRRIVEAFGQAIKHLPWTEADSSRLLGEVHQLAGTRPTAKFPVLNALVDGAITRLDEVREIPAATAEIDPAVEDGTGPLLFLGQLVMMCMFSIATGDYPNLHSLCDKIVAGLGTAHKLSSSPAFVLATYAWRQGDLALTNTRHREAADWFLLAAHPITRSVHDIVAPKSRRKAALALTHLGRYDEAETVLSTDKTPPVWARTEFARFNNFARAGKVEEARAALQRMVGGVDFEVPMLFWASDIAKDAPEESARMQGAVLSGLLELYRSGKAGEGEQVDVLTLIRCLIRTTVGQLETASREERIDLTGLLVDHYKAGHSFAAKQLGQDGTDEDELLKCVKWLYTSAHGVVTQASTTTDFPTQLISNLYTEIANLIEIAQQLAPESALQARMLLSKFGGLTERIRKVREAEPGSPEARTAHGNLLPKLHKLRMDIIRAKDEDSNIEGLGDLQTALVGMAIDGYGALGEWAKLEELIENFTRDQPGLGSDVLRACATKTLGFAAEPEETGVYVMRLVLYQLQERGDVDVRSMASWLRLLISTMEKSTPAYDSESLDHVKQAIELIRSDPEAYGKDEIAWLSSTAWDKGSGYVVLGMSGDGAEDGLSGEAEASAMRQAGEQWCETGLELARLGKLEWAEQIGAQWGRIGEQRALEERLM